jgi:hypothetical protein
MHSNQYCTGSGTGTPAYFEEDLPDVLSMLLLRAMKVNAPLPLSMTRKRLQLCYAPTTMWPTVLRDQANFHWGHKCLKDGKHKHKP